MYVSTNTYKVLYTYYRMKKEKNTQKVTVWSQRNL